MVKEKYKKSIMMSIRSFDPEKISPGLQAMD